MLVLINNLQPFCKKKDIELLIQRSISKFFWIKNQKEFSVNLFYKKFINSPSTEYYAIIFFQNDKIAKKIIKKLNNSYFYGKTILVKQYFIRCWQNDRRILNNKLLINNIRIEDRRRGTDLITF